MSNKTWLKSKVRKKQNFEKMGNYKSRPQTSCSEELRKKISEFHVVLRKKLQNDLQMPLPNEMSEFVEACALAQTERISTFAKVDEINQIMEEKGIYPCHLCCQSSSVVSTLNRLSESFHSEQIPSEIILNGFDPEGIRS